MGNKDIGLKKKGETQMGNAENPADSRLTLNYGHMALIPREKSTIVLTFVNATLHEMLAAAINILRSTEHSIQMVYEGDIGNTDDDHTKVIKALDQKLNHLLRGLVKAHAEDNNGMTGREKFYCSANGLSPVFNLSRFIERDRF